MFVFVYVCMCAWSSLVACENTPSQLSSYLTVWSQPAVQVWVAFLIHKQNKTNNKHRQMRYNIQAIVGARKRKKIHAVFLYLFTFNTHTQFILFVCVFFLPDTSSLFFTLVSLLRHKRVIMNVCVFEWILTWIKILVAFDSCVKKKEKKSAPKPG